MKQYIFGAKATAIGLYIAMTVLKQQDSIGAFIVSKQDNNPDNILGCPVVVLDNFVLGMSEKVKENLVIYVAVPEMIHVEIRQLLLGKGFKKLIMVDSRYEAIIMEKYFSRMGIFSSIHSLAPKHVYSSISLPGISVYIAKFYKDKMLENEPQLMQHLKSLYLGCYDANRMGINILQQADFYDDTGDNISAKNPNRCEMTAHYWIWKNRLDTEDEYVGVYHYRRFLDVSDDDLRRMKANDVDVVLPFPMIHYPSALIHHTWYVREEDWLVMRQALRELHPEYDTRFDEIFAQPYFYNYNIMIAKKSVFADYCAWLFPILDAIEERSEPKGKDRADRYTAYMSESLTTLYFMYHQHDLRIYHTGRLLFT